MLERITVFVLLLKLNAASLTGSCNRCFTSNDIACLDETHFVTCFDGLATATITKCPDNHFCTDDIYICRSSREGYTPVCYHNDFCGDCEISKGIFTCVNETSYGFCYGGKTLQKDSLRSCPQTYVCNYYARQICVPELTNEPSCGSRTRDITETNITRTDGATDVTQAAGNSTTTDRKTATTKMTVNVAAQGREELKISQGMKQDTGEISTRIKPTTDDSTLSIKENFTKAAGNSTTTDRKTATTKMTVNVAAQGREELKISQGMKQGTGEISTRIKPTTDDSTLSIKENFTKAAGNPTTTDRKTATTKMTVNVAAQGREELKISQGMKQDTGEISTRIKPTTDDSTLSIKENFTKAAGNSTTTDRKTATTKMTVNVAAQGREELKISQGMKQDTGEISTRIKPTTDDSTLSIKENFTKAAGNSTTTDRKTATTKMTVNVAAQGREELKISQGMKQGTGEISTRIKPTTDDSTLSIKENFTKAAGNSTTTDRKTATTKMTVNVAAQGREELKISQGMKQDTGEISTRIKPTTDDSTLSIKENFTKAAGNSTTTDRKTATTKMTVNVAAQGREELKISQGMKQGTGEISTRIKPTTDDSTLSIKENFTKAAGNSTTTDRKTATTKMTVNVAAQGREELKISQGMKQGTGEISTRIKPTTDDSTLSIKENFTKAAGNPTTTDRKTATTKMTVNVAAQGREELKISQGMKQDTGEISTRIKPTTDDSTLSIKENFTKAAGNSTTTDRKTATTKMTVNVAAQGREELKISQGMKQGTGEISTRIKPTTDDSTLSIKENFTKAAGNPTTTDRKTATTKMTVNVAAQGREELKISQGMKQGTGEISTRIKPTTDDSTLSIKENFAKAAGNSTTTDQRAVNEAAQGREELKISQGMKQDTGEISTRIKPTTDDSTLSIKENFTKAAGNSTTTDQRAVNEAAQGREELKISQGMKQDTGGTSTRKKPTTDDPTLSIKENFTKAAGNSTTTDQRAATTKMTVNVAAQGREELKISQGMKQGTRKTSTQIKTTTDGTTPPVKIVNSTQLVQTTPAIDMKSEITTEISTTAATKLTTVNKKTEVKTETPTETKTIIENTTLTATKTNAFRIMQAASPSKMIEEAATEMPTTTTADTTAETHKIEPRLKPSIRIIYNPYSKRTSRSGDVICEEIGNTGNFETDDPTCREYVYCFYVAGQYLGLFYYCDGYFNAATKTCQREKPVNCVAY